MYGFKLIGQSSDRTLARYLRRHKAIDTWESIGNSNQWRDPSGKVVAVCVYDNAACSYRCFIPEGNTL